VLVPVAWWVAVLLDVAAWIALGVAAGWWWAGRPAAWFDGRGGLLRLRSFEARGRCYERSLHVRRWKDRLPEAGTWFGGPSKRRLVGGRAGFARESARAEAVHWTLLVAVPLFAVWNPLGLFLAMVAYAVVANVPCIVVARYNRARVAALQAKRPS
jgi:glycosyl-4,4'-diaponeurosporenoate acyltransferase